MTATAIERVADGQVSLTLLIAGLKGYLDIITHDPVSVVVFEVFHFVGTGGILHGPYQIALTVVVMLGVIHGDNTLPLHIGLTCEDEDLDRGIAGDSIRRSEFLRLRLFIDPYCHCSFVPVCPCVVRDSSNIDAFTI